MRNFYSIHFLSHVPHRFSEQLRCYDPLLLLKFIWTKMCVLCHTADAGISQNKAAAKTGCSRQPQDSINWQMRRWRLNLVLQGLVWSQRWSHVYITTERTCEHKGSALLICQLSKTRLQHLRSLEKISAGAIIMYSVDGIWNNCVGPVKGDNTWGSTLENTNMLA